MKFQALCLAAAFAALSVAPTFAATPMKDTDCTAWMGKYDKNADGNLAMDEGKPFADKMTEMKMAMKDPAMMSKEEFMAACTKGDFEGIPAEPAAQ
jgi:hypothetical protein